MRAEKLVESLVRRGIALEACGDALAVEPAERLELGELEVIREHKQEILRLFASGRLVVRGCPDEGCGAVLCVFDGLAFCNAHAMTIRFVERPQ